MKRTLIIASALALGISLTPAVAHAGEGTYEAACVVNGSSTFTATRSGFYYYAWRDGSTALGGGIAYVRAGRTWTQATDSDATPTAKFGVLRLGSTGYSYVTCTGGSD